MEEVTVTHDELFDTADASATFASSSKQYLDDVLARLQTILASDGRQYAEEQLAATRALFADFIAGCLHIYLLHNPTGTVASPRPTLPRPQPPQPGAGCAAWNFVSVNAPAPASVSVSERVDIAAPRPAQPAYSRPPSPGRAVFERVNELTEREKEVLHWIAEGKTSREVGMILLIAERTVKFHLRNIYSKLNVLNRTQAVTIASRMNLA